MYKESLVQFVRAVGDSPDKDCTDMVEDIIESASEYLKRVSMLEGALISAKCYKEGMEYKEYIETLDKRRHIAHESLIGNVKAFNRMCRNHNVPVLYIGDEQDRVMVGKFAQELINEIFSSKTL